MKSEIEDKVIKKMDESIEEVLEGDFTVGDVDTLYKLVKTKHIAKEDKEMMNYGNYYGNYGGRRAGYDSYGRGNYGNYSESYGRRGYDSRYRGHDHIDRMYDDYGRYMESRERYGAGDQETDKSFHYMVKALEDFIKVLHEEAETPQQKQQLMESLQNSMR